jgi:hypothetical protein
MGRSMNRDLFLPTPEGEMRLLLLIDAFSNQQEGLQGRTKLAKLDFLLRYPEFLKRALQAKSVDVGDDAQALFVEPNPIEQRMVRYRFGPWDPSYFSLLGSLLGRGLITVVPYNRGLGYKTTSEGSALANRVRSDPSWRPLYESTKLLRRHFNLAGSTLKRFVYDTFPEVGSARWNDPL